MPGRGQLLIDAARVGAHVARERVTRPRPEDRSEIPPSPESLTTGWLTGTLCGDHPGAEVTQFFLGAPNEGTTSRRAIVVDYNGAGREAGLPTRLFIKCSTSFLSRLIMGLTGAADAEIGFYNEIRPNLAIECPMSYYAASDRASQRATLLLEDVTATRHVTWLGVADTHVSKAMAEDIVDNLARLHGAFWADPRLAEFEWLPTAERFQRQLIDVGNCEHRSLVGLERAQAAVPDELAARRNDIHRSLMRALAHQSRQPPTLIHQDVHPLNWYRTSEERMGLFDWNGAASGSWAIDVSYAITSCLEIDDRRAWERELLARYCEQLAAAGGDPPRFDGAWDDYRRHIFHGLMLWLFVAGAGRMQPVFHTKDVWTVVLGRIGQAVIDLGSFDLCN